MQKVLNIKKILIITLVIITLGFAWKYYQKYKGAQKLKLSTIELSPTDKITNVQSLLNIFLNGLHLKGFIKIRSFTDKDFVLNQSSIDCFTPISDKRIAEQINILQKGIKLEAKQVSYIPIEYTLDSIAALKLFKESGVIPEDTTLLNVVTHPEKYYNQIDLNKLRIKLKGFIEAEGITLKINQDQMLYE